MDSQAYALCLLRWRFWRTGGFCGGIWRAAGGSKRERQEVREAQIARFSEHGGVDSVHVVGRRSAGHQVIEWTYIDMAVVALVSIVAWSLARDRRCQFSPTVVAILADLLDRLAACRCQQK